LGLPGVFWDCALKPFSAALSFGLLCGGAADADPAVRVWQTQPDRKALVSHIQVMMCGRSLCGTVLRALDRRGKEVVSRNVGKKAVLGPQAAGRGATVTGALMTRAGCEGFHTPRAPRGIFEAR